MNRFYHSKDLVKRYDCIKVKSGFMKRGIDKLIFGENESWV